MGRRKEQEGAEGGTRERLGHGQDIGKYPEHQRRIHAMDMPDNR